MGFDGRTPLAYGIGVCLLGFGGRGVFEFGRDVFGFAPSLALPSLPRWGEKRVRGGVGFGLGRWWYVLGRISGLNHFVVGGVWLRYPP